MYSNKRLGRTIISQEDSIPLYEIGGKLNNNVLILGTPGSGKTRSIIKPNLLEMNSSYVIIDTKGELTREFAGYFAQHDYDVRVLDTVTPLDGMRYNPLAYARTDLEVRTLAESIYLAAATCSSANSNTRFFDTPFWEASATMLLEALLLYLRDTHEKADGNLGGLAKLLDRAEAKEEDEDWKSPLDLLIEAVKTGEILETHNGETRKIRVNAPNPKAPCVRKYRSFRKAAGKTLKSILISLNAPLAVLLNEETLQATTEDEFDLTGVGDKKTAIFLVCSDTNHQRNALAGIMLSQLFVLLTHQADEFAGTLGHHVRFILDDFATIGYIPGFTDFISTCRSRNMSAIVVAQNQAQLLGTYGLSAPSIMGCCDTWLYLGGQDSATQADMARKAGCSVVHLLDELKPGGCLCTQKFGKGRFERLYPLESHPRYNDWQSSIRIPGREVAQEYRRTLQVCHDMLL
jgi:type IV secretion system protein VirD4